MGKKKENNLEERALKIVSKVGKKEQKRKTEFKRCIKAFRILKASVISIDYINKSFEYLMLGGGIRFCRIPKTKDGVAVQETLESAILNAMIKNAPVSLFIRRMEILNMDCICHGGKPKRIDELVTIREL